MNLERWLTMLSLKGEYHDEVLLKNAFFSLQCPHVLIHSMACVQILPSYRVSLRILKSL